MPEQELPLIERLQPGCPVRVRKALRKLGCRKVNRTLDRPSAASDEQCRELVALLVRAVQGRDEEAADRLRRRFEELSSVQEPERVQVRILGAPAWLDTSAWDGQRPASQARWVLREIHGLCVAGHELEVRCEPPLRAGRGGPRRGSSELPQGLDEEARYSFTPLDLARAFVRGTRGRVIDGTCGAGGLALALAEREQVEHVLAVDLDAGRLRVARREARARGLDHKMSFHTGSAAEVLDRPHDTLVLDPPWGGVDYDRERYGLDALGLDLLPLLSSPARVLLKLPRSFLVDQLPGAWSLSGELDGRGVLKFLRAERSA
jgi:SAM-dependent methyltransferase